MLSLTHEPACKMWCLINTAKILNLGTFLFPCLSIVVYTNLSTTLELPCLQTDGYKHRNMRTKLHNSFIVVDNKLIIMTILTWEHIQRRWRRDTLRYTVHVARSHPRQNHQTTATRLNFHTTFCRLFHNQPTTYQVSQQLWWQVKREDFYKVMLLTCH